MNNLKTYLVIGLLLCQIWMVVSNCKIEKVRNGTISDFSREYYKEHSNCWLIEVPANQYIQIQFTSWFMYGSSCKDAKVEVNLMQPVANYTYCNSVVPAPLVALSDVKILFYHRLYFAKNSPSLGFTLKYEIHDVECAQKHSFHCSSYSCIPNTEVCDGINDCENGEDEVGCETGVLSISGVAEARSAEISVLKSKRTTSWGWQDNTPRAVTAMYLAGGANFNGTDLEEELMAKQTELKTSIALLKSPISNEKLSTLINGLLVTCHSPRHFYGQNLIKRLKNQINSSNNVTHPIAYLTLCNANDSWPHQASENLKQVLTSKSDYPFVRDYRAIAVMAISCYDNATKFLNKTENRNLKKEYESVVQYFKEIQRSDGSFGNYHTTSLISQALISSGQEHAKDWKLNATIKYLMSTPIPSHDLLAISLSLPVLNGKSLADIAKVNCSANPRKHHYDNIASEINDYAGPKIRIQYSIFVGDEKDIIHTISLRVPENYTAFDVMELAEVQDYKFKFKTHTISGMVYVYEIGEIVNDPEAGLFWLLYHGQINETDSIKHYNIGPDKLIMNNGEHLVMWYRKANV